MAKQLNIDLNVNANTSLARQELALLQNTLKQLTTASGEISRNLTTGMDLSKTIAQVNLLRALLQSATNVDTGVLNFTKLNLSIQQANTSLLDYGRTLNNLGPTGQKAFLQLATAVSKSEIPISLTNGMLKQFGTTMKNTLRWQASSMLLHGTVNAIQKAWNYAQKLDRSLTDIQIVTKQSDAQMAKFAESANKAARALSTSTTAYTDAALIYYQLGLNDRQVKERTDVTVKMANVTGRTAEKVSNQMTAIWNNFDNGSKSLEYYADVITALGAATASSSDEIATGLSKFAAVADTVGLSYENATAALATITATTRQSADSVGNGLKTLFSRLQSLSLGKTLEDGVNLTKYTKALNTVGVSALDAAGNLRSMDSILADLGERWNTLSSAQLNALAQTVGGVRLYVTFTALMDNYDFFKDNIQIAKNASGELLKQADVYDKSWAAARKHVLASAEAIYSDLIDDKFFTGLTNGFAGVLHLVDNLIDGIGGIKGVLLTAGTAMATFGKKGTAAFFDNSINSIRTLFPSGVRALQDERTRVLEGYLKMLLRPTDLNGNELPLNYAMQQQGLALARILPLLNEFAQNLNSYSLLLLLSNLNLLDTLTTRGENIVLTAEQVMTALTLLDNINTLLYNTVLPATKSRGAINIGANLINGGNFAANTLGGILSTGEGSYIRALTELLLSSLNGASDFSSQASQAELARLSKFFEDYNGFEIDDGKGGTIAASYALRNAATPEDWTRIIGSIRNAVTVGIENEIKRTSNGVTDAEIKETKNLAMQSFNTRLSIYLNEEKNRRENKELDDLAKKGFLTVPSNMSIGTGMAEAASMLGGLGMGLSILKSSVSNLSNPNMSGADKFLSIATSIGMATPMLRGVGKGILNSSLLQWLGSGADNTARGNALIKRGQTIQNNVIELEMQRIAQLRLDSKMYGTRFGSTKGILANYGDDIRAEAMANYGTLPGGNTMNAGLRAISRGRGNSLTTRLANNKTILQIGLRLGMGGKDATAEIAGQGMAGGIKVAAIMAIIAGAVAIGKQVEAAIETPTEKLERLNELVANAKVGLQEAQESYDNFMNNTSTRAKALESIKELNRTTIEYKQTVLQANAASREIINQANLRNGVDYTYDANGIIQFTSDKVLEQAQEEQYNKVTAANIRSLSALSALSNYLAINDYEKAIKTIEVIQDSYFHTDQNFYNNDELQKIAKRNNLGSAEELYHLYQEGKLLQEMMIGSNAANSNQALLTEIATNLSVSGKIGDLEQLAINALMANDDFWQTLQETSDKGIKNNRAWGRTLQWYKNRYEEQFGSTALDEILNSDRYMNTAKNADKERILRDEIISARYGLGAEDRYNKVLSELLASLYANLYNTYQSKTLEKINEEIGKNFTIDEKGNYTLSEAGKQLSEVEQQYQLTILDLYKSAFEGVSTLAAAAGFSGQTNIDELSKLNIEQLKQILSIGNQYKQQFGTKGLTSIFANLVSGSDDFRNSMQNVIGDDAILTLFNLNDKGLTTQYNQLRADIGDKGLFEALYDSEGFKSSLESLNKTFEEMGSISASNVLKLADSSKTLSNYLDLSGTNAQGLADTIAALASGDIDINRLSNSLVKAYSATGIVASNLADSYKYISDYEKGTSIETIPNFYESLEGTIYKSVKAGNIMDEPVLNAILAILGTEGKLQWMIDAAKASTMGFTAGNNWMLNESASASLWKTISQIYKTGNMLPIFAELFNGTLENFDTDLVIEGTNGVKLSDIFRYGNGEIITKTRGLAGTNFLDIFKTQDEFIQYLLNETPLGQRYSEETIRNAVSEYTNKNEALNLAWTSNGIIAGAQELVGVNLTTNADNLRKFLKDNSLLIGAMTDELRSELATTLGLGTDYDFGIENGKIDVDKAVTDATKAHANLVNLNGLDYEKASYKAIQQAYENEDNGNKYGSFEEYLKSGIDSIVNAQTPYSASDLDSSVIADNLKKLSPSQQLLVNKLLKEQGFDELNFDILSDRIKTQLDADEGALKNAVLKAVIAKPDRLGEAVLGEKTAEKFFSPDNATTYYDFDELVGKFTDLGIAAEDAVKYIQDSGIQTSRAVWDNEANEGKGAWTVETQREGETVELFLERTGGTDAQRMAEYLHELSLRDSANAMIMAYNALNHYTEESPNYIPLLEDILDAEGNIADNTAEFNKETLENASVAGTSNRDQNKQGENTAEPEEPAEGATDTEIEAAQKVNEVEAKPIITGLTNALQLAYGGGEGHKKGEPSSIMVDDEGKVTYTFKSQEDLDEWQKNQDQGKASVTINEASGLNNHIPGFASGYQGPATVGELGPETWIHDGQMDIVGQKGRETIWVNPSDTILTAGQTDRLLGGHKPGFVDSYNADEWSGAYKTTGGGGGARRGSGSGKKDDDDKWKDSWEPYHEISREVQRLTTDVENLNTEMERAFGVEKIQKMEDELELLDLRLLQEADYIAEAEKYIAEYEQYLPDGTEVVDGVILNYDALLEKYLKDIYEAQEKRDRDKLEKLQREWLRIQLYEQHTDKLEERRQEQLNLLYQKADLMLQQLLYSIDLVNSSLDESQDLIDYMLNHMNTDMFKMAESIALVGDATDITIQKMELAKQSIQDYEDMLGTEYANDEELVNSILQERNNLLKLNQELDKQRDNVIKKLTYTIQEFNNELKKATKLLSNYNTLIKNYTDLSELMGLSAINNTEQIDKLNDALKNNMGLNIQATKSQLETNQALIAQMEADFEANPWMREAYDDVYQKLVEEGQGLSVTLSNNLQSMLNFIVKEFETELDRALTSFQDQITKGFGTWDELTSAANSLKGAQDVNTKAYDRVYQLNTLIRDMDSYMNDMTSAKNHNSILKFQELIKKLKADNTDLSQEELDVLRAQFELMLAQFDLEDAQNAKNQVRLQRDMNGNWGYVYTADEDAMAEAQLNVDDKLKAYLDAVTALLQVQGEYMGTVAELEIQEQELRNELNQLGHTDEDEERRALLLKLIAELENLLNIYRQSLDRMEGSLNDAIEIGRNNINEIWDENVDLQAALKDLPMLILAGQLTTVEEFFNTLGDAEGKFIERTDAAKDAYMEQYEEWAPYLEKFNNGLGDMATQSEKAVTNLDALNELYLQEFTDAMKAAVDWEKEYGIQMENIIKLNLEFIQSLTYMINDLREVNTLVPSVSFKNTTDTSLVAATIASMDSGGYTGAWGTSGKIAMLHEKEQVFNAQDTLNLLTAALILRTIDASANSMAIGLNNMITPKIDGVAQQIDLTVNISASFPNAVNHFEIEEAFNNLTNKAVQFANRKNA